MLRREVGVLRACIRRVISNLICDHRDRGRGRARALRMSARVLLSWHTHASCRPHARACELMSRACVRRCLSCVRRYVREHEPSLSASFSWYALAACSMTACCVHELCMPAHAFGMVSMCSPGISMRVIFYTYICKRERFNDDL